MKTKSSIAEKRYVAGSSRGSRSVTTLLAQMEDLQRGERIKALRDERRLTQPAVVDLLEKAAGGKVVTLRGYQAWEAGGGIRWENAKVLAEVFGVEPEYVMSGERGETPDLLDRSPEAQFKRLEERLQRLEQAVADERRERRDHSDRIEDLLSQQNSLLREQSDLLGMLRTAVSQLGVGDEVTLQDRLVQVVRDAAARAGAPSEPRARR